LAPWRAPPVGLDAGAQRHERNGRADTDREVRREIAVPSWRRGRRRWQWRWKWCRHTSVGRRIEYGSETAFGRVTHAGANHCHECDGYERRRAGNCQTTNYAHHRRPPSGLPRPPAWTRIYAPRGHHFTELSRKLYSSRWSRGEASAGGTRPCRRRAARQVGVRARRANNC